MTSYQRRKQQIEFLRQRGEDLEAIVFMLADQLRSAGQEPLLPMGSLGGICGDRFISDVTTGEFAMRVLSTPTTNGATP